MKTVLWKRFNIELENDQINDFIKNSISYLKIDVKEKKILFLLNSIKNTKKNTEKILSSIIDSIANYQVLNYYKILTSINSKETININNKGINISSLAEERYLKINKHDILKNYNYNRELMLSKHYLPTSFFDFDFLIPITIFDKSEIFNIHGNISSLFWFLPTYTRNEILVKSDKSLMAKSLLELFALIKDKILFSIILFDKDETFITLSDDAISGDAFSSALIGTKAFSVNTTKIGNKLNLGIGDIMKLYIAEDKFCNPLQIIKRKRTNTLPKINSNTCTLCNICLNNCPLSAIFELNKKLYFNYNKCNKCYYCIELCPSQSIQ